MTYTYNRGPNEDMLGVPVEVGDIVVTGGASRNTTIAGKVVYVDATSSSLMSSFGLAIETFGNRRILRRTSEVVVARATDIK